MLWRGLLILLFTLSGCSDTKQIESKVQVARYSMLSAAISRNGQYMFSGSLNYGGSLWRLTDQERLFDWNLDASGSTAFRSAAFSEDGKFLAATEQKSLGLWDTTSGQSIRYWQTPFNILALSMAQQYVLLGQENQYAVLFDVVRGGVIGGLKHDGAVSSVSLDDSGKYALTGSHDGFARYWSMDTGDVIHAFPQGSPIEYVTLSASGKLALVSAYKRHVTIYHTDSGGEMILLYKKNLGVISAAFNANEDKILLGTTRGKIIHWDLKRQQQIDSWQVKHSNPRRKSSVIALAYSEPDFTAATSNGLIYKFH